MNCHEMLRALWPCLSTNYTHFRERESRGGEGEEEIGKRWKQATYSATCILCQPSKLSPHWSLLQPPGGGRPYYRHPLPFLHSPPSAAGESALKARGSNPDLLICFFHSLLQLLLLDFGINTFEMSCRSKHTHSKSAAFNSWVFPKVYFFSSEQ